MVIKPLLEITYYFVDESGDPTFYDRYKRLIIGKEGCSPILLIGFIRTTDPKPLRKAMLELKEEVRNDKYFQGIPSINKTLRAFHAKDDIPEVRERVYKTLLNLDFKTEFIVARKIQNIFITRHKQDKNIFYDDIVSKLFENRLHRSKKNIIYFATRDNKSRQAPLELAVENAENSFEGRWNKKINSTTTIYPQQLSVEPCLQIVDYMNWAVQRAFLRGEERYYKFIEEKVSYLCDIYDFDKYPRNFYNKRNTFSITKMSPL